MISRRQLIDGMAAAGLDKLLGANFARLFAQVWLAP
jgi:hypothetical protein